LSAKQPNVAGVKVARVIEDQAPPRLQYDPKNPLADANGYVTLPNVNPVEEMVNMISASRSYQTNADMMNAAKTMLLKTLQLGQA
jgi:flagellar basal-body rod protein FlgC